jgi:hypothetical protein
MIYIEHFQNKLSILKNFNQQRYEIRELCTNREKLCNNYSEILIDLCQFNHPTINPPLTLPEKRSASNSPLLVV